MVSLAELLVADEPQAWRDAGFTVDQDGVCRIGTVRVRLLGSAAGSGVVGWRLRDVVPPLESLDGLPTEVATEAPADPDEHPLGALRIDHLVVMSPDLARTTAALEAIGAPTRRVRDYEVAGVPIRQVFFRLGEVILELVGDPSAAGEGPATFWGLTHTVADIDAAVSLLGERTDRVKDAVQPGRRITTLRHHELGMSVATALMSPPPERS
jgi:hypothetical protein